MLCGDVNGSRFQNGGDTCKHVADSLCWTTEAITIPWNNYTPIKLIKKEENWIYIENWSYNLLVGFPYLPINSWWFLILDEVMLILKSSFLPMKIKFSCCFPCCYMVSGRPHRWGICDDVKFVMIKLNVDNGRNYSRRGLLELGKWCSFVNTEHKLKRTHD